MCVNEIINLYNDFAKHKFPKKYRITATKSIMQIVQHLKTKMNVNYQFALQASLVSIDKIVILDYFSADLISAQHI